MFPHFYIAADTDPVDHVVGMADVVLSPTPPDLYQLWEVVWRKEGGIFFNLMLLDRVY